MSEIGFVEKLISSIIDNKDMPKVQVERELSPILDIFMSDILKQLVGKEGDEFKYILSEFPLQTLALEKGKKTNRSKNIDSLFLKNNDTLIFLELKTDSDSYDIKQKDFYKNVIEKIKLHSAEFLFVFLCVLTNKSTKKKKYRRAYNSIESKGFNIEQLKKIKKVELVYIVPKAIQEKLISEDGIDKVVSFTDISKIKVSKYKEEWSIIREKIIKLDDDESNEAQVCPNENKSK